MNILVLGGTGAMGRPLTDLLAKSGHNVWVTTRSEKKDKEGIQYYTGNAKDLEFIESVLNERKWDCIVDFMAYSTIEFRNRYEMLLLSTYHYIFISSARVFSEPNGKITEKSDRLLDVSGDSEYLQTDEYALTKARQEDILRNSGFSNWSIVRPTITYSKIRLQLGALEKENWLYRALHGRSIVFSNDIADKYTTMSSAEDVAKGICGIIEHSEETKCEDYNVVSDKSYKWIDILNAYVDEIGKVTGKKPNAVITEKSVKLRFPEDKYQVIYSRYFNRSFDNSKIRTYVDVDSFTDPLIGIRVAINGFLKNPSFGMIDWRVEAYSDQEARERTKLKEIDGLRNKIVYVLYRYNLESVYKLLKNIKGLFR